MSRNGIEVLWRTDSLTIGPVDLSDWACVGRTQPTIITDITLTLTRTILGLFTVVLLVVEERCPGNGSNCEMLASPGP